MFAIQCICHSVLLVLYGHCGCLNVVVHALCAQTFSTSYKCACNNQKGLTPITPPESMMYMYTSTSPKWSFTYFTTCIFKKHGTCSTLLSSSKCCHLVKMSGILVVSTTWIYFKVRIGSTITSVHAWTCGSFHLLHERELIWGLVIDGAFRAETGYYYEAHDAGRGLWSNVDNRGSVNVDVWT